MLPTKFQVSWPFHYGEEAENRISRWWPWQPSWISDRNNFRYFLSISPPQCFLPRFKSIGLSNGLHDGHLGFRIGMILAIFDLQVTAMLFTKFQVNWGFGSGEKAKNRFSRWLPQWPSWISNHDEFSYFWSTNLSHSNAFYQVSSQLALWFRRRSKK